MKNETMNVAGMSCAHLPAKVGAGIGKLPGASADADANLGTIAVSYDEAVVSREEIEAAIREAGYAAES